MVKSSLEKSTFSFNKSELKLLDKFEKQHYNKCKTTDFLIKTSQTGIGVHIQITCLVCKKEKDISDYNTW